MRQHFIMDSETLGQNTFTCPVLDFSYVVFDWDRFTSDPYTIDELVETIRRDKLDVSYQTKDLGYVVEKSTIEWWGQQAPEVRAKIKPDPNLDVTVPVFLDNLFNYLDGCSIKYWWSRSNTFDPVILARLARDQGRTDEMDRHLKFWAVRDTRTFIDAKLSFPARSKNSFTPIDSEETWNEKFKQHSSVHDVMADVLRLQTLTRLENDLSIPE